MDECVLRRDRRAGDFQAALSQLFELTIIQNAREDDVDPIRLVGAMRRSSPWARHSARRAHANLRAEIMAAAPDKHADVRARYGMGDADRLEVQAWGRKFATDVALFERYKSLFQHFRAQNR